MFAYPARPKRPPPAFDGAELHFHAHRRAPGISPAERALVVVFLARYIVWCAKARRIERLRNSLCLLLERRREVRTLIRTVRDLLDATVGSGAARSFVMHTPKTLPRNLTAYWDQDP